MIKKSLVQNYIVGTMIKEALASGTFFFSAAAKGRPVGAVPRLLLTDTLHPAGNPTRRRRPRFWGLPQVLCQTPPGEQTASSAWQVSTINGSQVSLIPIMVALRMLAKRRLQLILNKYNIKAITFNRASSINFIL